MTRSPLLSDARAFSSLFCLRDITKNKGTKKTSIIKIGIMLPSGEDAGGAPPEGDGASCTTPGVPALGCTFCAKSCSLESKVWVTARFAKVPRRRSASGLKRDAVG